jgi:transposase
MKKYIVRLTEPERAELLELVARGKAARHKRTHARVLLKTDAGSGGAAWTDTQIAEALELHPNTVAGIRQRFVEQGLEAALNRKKRVTPARARKLDGRGEARLIALACGEPPAGHARWTLRLLADQLVVLEMVDSISHETVRQVLKKTS